MQELLARQSAIIKEIEKIHINYKKDSAIRKTSEYFQKRIAAIDNLWGEFEQNNKTLQRVEDKSSEYFKKEIYSEVKQFYTTLRATVISDSERPPTPTITQISSPSTSKATPGTVFQVPKIHLDASQDHQEILVQQYAKFRALERQLKRISEQDIEEKWEIEEELRSLQQRWHNIDELHLRIDSLSSEIDSQYEEAFTAIESKYLATRKNLNQKLSANLHLQQSLPQIEIPIFTGKYVQWPTFHDLYTEAIHNNKHITNAQKMQHLKCKIKGEAERMIQHLHISAENYEVAWEILNHRYNNPQLLFTKQIELFLNQPNINKQSSYELKKLYDITTECIHAIHNLGVDTNSWDPLLVHILCKKLDMDTYSDYKEARKEPRSLPTLEEFMTFIESKFTALEPIQRREKGNNITTRQVHQTSRSSNSNKKPTVSQYPNRHIFSKGLYQAAPTYTRKSCIVCKASHDLYMCPAFFNLSSREQFDIMQKNKICINCLYTHQDQKCISTRRCKECNEPHNTKIHEAFMQLKTKSASSKLQTLQNVDASPSTSSASLSSTGAPNLSKMTKQHHINYVATDGEEVLLTTVAVKVQSADGTFITLTALLDQGSQVTLISENAAQLLGLQRQRYHASVSGIGPSAKHSKGMVTLVCKSIYEDYQFTTEALVMSRVINNLPNSSFKIKPWPHIRDLNLADPKYNISKPIDLLLDASIYSDIIMEGLIRGPSHAPIAQLTKLGWILSGNVKTFSCNVILNQVEDLSKYWEVEDIQESSVNTTLSESEQYCEDLYQATTRRLEDGRYEVAIPMKPNFWQNLGHSKSIALARFSHIERKMANNKELSDSYKQFMNEYESLGHMRKVKDSTNMNFAANYLPHHGVVKSDSTTTKLRVVFNASAKTSSGQSLNDLMESGPNLQQDLQGLILKWREHRYVMISDIEKMFRQIRIRTSDQPLQSIIWRCSPNDVINTYHLTTVTYGTKAAPYLAMRTLRQIAFDNEERYPSAAKALTNSCYMDDLICGTDNITEAKNLQKELIEVLRSAGMNLRKWSSNTSELTKDLSYDQLDTFEFKDVENRKTLGLRWNPASDTFSFQCKLTEGLETNITKRELLSEISKIYDPLGWLSPLTIRGKILFQQTWLSSLSWDDKLPDSIQDEWNELKRDLMKMDIFQIPRYLGHIGQSLHLHGFCDASEKAYACAIYLVTLNDKGAYTSKLITAKTKVVPTKKQLSLPKLELLGALLLSQLMKKVLEILYTSKEIHLHAWTDSMIVLGWLHGDISKWKQFVATRIRHITNVIPAKYWRHVKSEENAADCATRGLSSISLYNHSLWWEGPKFIQENQQRADLETYQEPTLEKKKNHSVQAALQSSSDSIIYKLLNEMSSITRVAKIIAWVSRFIYRARKNVCQANNLAASNIEDAFKLIIKTVQKFEFFEEMSSLKKHRVLKSNSRLLNLNPYLDKDDILRVGGRLENTILRYSAKHPILLPTSSRLTELIIDQAHRTTLHGGPKLTLAYIRDTYWIVSGVRAVKSQLRNCIKCRRFSQTTKHQIMADLPPSRVTPARPFLNVGVDFTGHVEIKLNKGKGVRTSKGYIAVFVCMATKAVHIELVSDLSTEAFLAALRRLCSRRGTPKNIYSDNGTNFVGASKFLKREYKDIVSSINHEVIDNISEMGITWHFNAPSWPSAGGLWEAAVKSLKQHLKRVMGDQKLTYEELITLLQQIEACLNSRPLCALTEDPDDVCITPGHFLVGGPLLSRPQTDPDITHVKQRWQLVQSMNKQIWRGWSREYLQNLQTRARWTSPTKDIELNDIVVIKEDHMPPGKWALARVCELHPGKDGHTRVVTLKTQNNVLQRPVSKLIVLPVGEKEKDQKEEPKSSKNQEPKRNLRTRKNIFKTFFINLIFIMTFVSPSHQTINITRIEPNKSLYFDKIADMRIIKDQWTLVAYYNLTSYWKNIENIEKYIHNLSTACNETKLTRLCTSTLSHFINELDEIKHYNNMLVNTEPYHRAKRGLINGVGYIANTLFGVLDDKFAEQYRRDIEILHQNEDHLLNLMKNQTSIVETENNIIFRNEQRMNEQFVMLNNQLGQLAKENNIIKLSDYIITSTININNLISNIRRTQERLINTVTNIYQGRLDSHIIPPEQLKQQINIISGQINGDLSVPVKAENIKYLYDILHVKTNINSNYLILEINIPLITSDNYELDRVISLPLTMQRNTTYYAIPITEFMAFNMRKDTFIPMSQDDVLSCTKYHGGRLLCTQNTAIYQLKIKHSICDTEVLTPENKQTFCIIETKQCSDRWIKLHSSAAWLYISCGQCHVRAICPASLTSHTLSGSGIIALGQDCTVKGDTFTLLGHHYYTSDVNIQLQHQQAIMLPIISTLNNFINTSVSVPHTSRDEGVYDTMQRQIHALKEATINNTSIHDAHHYILIYFLLIVTGIFTGILTVLVCCHFIKRKRPSSSRKTPPEEPTEQTSPAPAPPVYALPARLCRSEECAPTATSTVTFPRLPRID